MNVISYLPSEILLMIFDDIRCSKAFRNFQLALGKIIFTTGIFDELKHRKYKKRFLVEHRKCMYDENVKTETKVYTTLPNGEKHGEYYHTFFRSFTSLITKRYYRSKLLKKTMYLRNGTHFSDYYNSSGYAYLEEANTSEYRYQYVKYKDCIDCYKLYMTNFTENYELIWEYNSITIEFYDDKRNIIGYADLHSNEEREHVNPYSLKIFDNGKPILCCLGYTQSKYSGIIEMYKENGTMKFSAYYIEGKLKWYNEYDEEGNLHRTEY